MKKIVLFALAALFAVVSYAQTTITGTVTSGDDGSPLPYASVLVQGTKTIVFTDDDGKFEIKAPSNATLVFQLSGFADEVVPVNNRSVINAVLKMETTLLDETIVVAYGTAKKGTYTGAASVVKADAIKDVQATSFENALNGKVAGLQMTQTSGQAGSATNIRIRGIGSMNASNEPLYVVDGVPVISGDIGQMSDYTYSTNNVMSTLNPSDIESITVLKDAAASALYGSRAANGVIMVTTKRGKIGKPTITFKASLGFSPSWATNNYELSTPEQQMQMLYETFWDYNYWWTSGNFKDAAASSADAIKRLNTKFNKHGYDIAASGIGRYDNVVITARTDGKFNHKTGEYYDWEKAYFRTSMFQSYDLSASGGTENTSYYTSISYTKDQGRVKINNYDRISGRVNLNQKIGKHVELSSNVSLASTRRSGYNDTWNNSSNLFMQSRNLLWGVYWPTDYMTGEPWTARYGSYAYNNLYYNDLWDNDSRTLKISANEALTVHILDGLDAKTIFSFDNTDTKDEYYISAEHFNAPSVEGEAVARAVSMDTQVQKLVSSSTLSYNKTFGEKHTVSALAGWEAEKNKTTFRRAEGKNLSTASLHTVATAGVLDANAYSWGNTMLSFLSKAEYNYDNRYYISGSFRRDGSSRLSEDTRWGNFWSVAASWRITNEKFMKNVEWLSNLRIRGSYGVNGTLPSSNYGWRALAAYGANYQEAPGGYISNVASKNLSWETSYTYNVALEFGLFNNRLNGTVEYFNRDSKDLLMNVPISRVTGFSSVLRNLGEVNNKGIEVELSGDIIATRDWKWSLGINAAFTKSKVTKLYKQEGESTGQDVIWYDPTGGDALCQFMYREGESMLAVYGLEWAGVDPTTGYNIWYSNNDNCDFQKDGRNVVYDYGDADEKIIGDLVPDVYGGINTEVSWKNLSLNLNFNYKIGDFYDAGEQNTIDDGYFWERPRSARMWRERWTDANTKGTLPRIVGCDAEDFEQYSTRHIHNGNFLRLKTMTLSYNFPKTIINKIGLTNTRVFFTGTNLLTWAQYNNVDPEVGVYGTRGWETPNVKTYTFGVEFSF
ncbi:MAG: TonB-dependent receptor [Bacteroidales bacterium]|nr:TonB-dependent receptor [Candidatus Egerieousia equi]MCQ2118019.1 TonB-dependent receptor [Bacteroidales bacterium]